MPTVFIPASLRKYTNHVHQLQIEARNVREVIEQLEIEFPGISDRLCESGTLRPGLAVAVDSRVSSHGLLEKVNANSEVHFVPTVSGG